VKQKKKQEDRAQKEFFEEFDYKPKWPRFLRKRHFPQRQMSLRLTYERLILFIAASCVLLVISFCLGVERGKNVVIPERFNRESRDVPSLRGPATNHGGDEAILSPNKKVAAVPQPKKTVKLVPAPPASDTAYSIQVATYIKKDTAEDELLRLKRDGLPAYMTQMGKFYLLTVGDYANREEAKKVEGKLKIRYNDCFVKKRRLD